MIMGAAAWRWALKACRIRTLTSERDALRAEVERMRPVFGAAMTLTDIIEQYRLVCECGAADCRHLVTTDEMSDRIWEVADACCQAKGKA